MTHGMGLTTQGSEHFVSHSADSCVAICEKIGMGGFFSFSFTFIRSSCFFAFIHHGRDSLVSLCNHNRPLCNTLSKCWPNLLESG